MKNFIYFALALPLFACAAETEPAASAPTEAAAVVTVDVKSENSVVKCGCDIESVGRCGNYVELEGEFVKITNSGAMDLGAMEWCSGKSGHALVEGKRTGSEIEVTRLEMVK